MLHNIVSINKNPNFVSESVSDQNVMEHKQKELLINSDTNALALTSD